MRTLRIWLCRGGFIMMLVFAIIQITSAAFGKYISFSFLLWPLTCFAAAGASRYVERNRF